MSWYEGPKSVEQMKMVYVFWTVRYIITKYDKDILTTDHLAELKVFLDELYWCLLATSKLIKRK